LVTKTQTDNCLVSDNFLSGSNYTETTIPCIDYVVHVWVLWYLFSAHHIGGLVVAGCRSFDHVGVYSATCWEHWYL